MPEVGRDMVDSEKVAMVGLYMREDLCRSPVFNKRKAGIRCSRANRRSIVRCEPENLALGANTLGARRNEY